MTTWSLTIDNRMNDTDKIYIIEDDELNIINTPDDLFKQFCFNSNTLDSNLAKRFYNNLVIGGTDFPSPCQEIANRGTGTLIVSENTKALKVWTYSNSTWTAQSNITKGIGSGTTIVLPSYKAKK